MSPLVRNRVQALALVRYRVRHHILNPGQVRVLLKNLLEEAEFGKHSRLHTSHFRSEQLSALLFNVFIDLNNVTADCSLVLTLLDEHRLCAH